MELSAPEELLLAQPFVSSNHDRTRVRSIIYFMYVLLSCSRHGQIIFFFTKLPAVISIDMYADKHAFFSLMMNIKCNKSATLVHSIQQR